MKDISFLRYSPLTSEDRRSAQLIECYREVFADGPWHEWKKCLACGRSWGKKDRALLNSAKFYHCGVPLVDFWSREQVKTDLVHEITSEASCWLALASNKVVGFCWGYPITTDDLEKKLGLPIKSKLGDKGLGLVAYQDEVGVILPYRGRGIAKAMLEKRLDDFLDQGLEWGIVRTRQSPEASQTFLWYIEKLGYEILSTYPVDDGRVILGRKLAGLKELLSP